MLVKECEYKLPCGRCNKYDDFCDAPKDYDVKFNCNHKWLTKIVESDYKDEHDNKYVAVHQACIYCGVHNVSLQQIESPLNT